MSGLRARVAELAELDLNNIGSWPAWVHVGAIVLLAVAILAGGMWYFVLPGKAILQDMRQHETVMKQAFIQKHTRVAGLDAHKQQLNVLKEQFRQRLEQLPQQAEMPELLRSVAQAARDSGLQEKLFKPLPVIKRDFYVILPNRMTIVGQYRELVEFAARIAALSRIVTFDSVDIKPVLAAGDGTLLITLTLGTYRYTGEGQ